MKIAQTHIRIYLLGLFNKLAQSVKPQDAKETEVFIQLGQTSVVNSVAFFPDGAVCLVGRLG